MILVHLWHWIYLQCISKNYMTFGRKKQLRKCEICRFIAWCWMFRYSGSVRWVAGLLICHVSKERTVFIFRGHKVFSTPWTLHEGHTFLRDVGKQYPCNSVWNPRWSEPCIEKVNRIVYISSNTKLTEIITEFNWRWNLMWDVKIYVKQICVISASRRRAKEISALLRCHAA